MARPLAPDAQHWREINTMTIGFGHGISVTPLHVVNGVATLANGGVLRQPTLVAQAPGAAREGVRAVSEKTSETMRRLMRLVVTDGSGKGADVPGYFVGGKTGTAQKTGPRGGYLENKRIAAFVGAFPMNAPRYAFYVMVDEPNPNAKSHGYATAGWVAAPAAGSVIRRIAPILGMVPEAERIPQIQQTISIPLQPPKPRAVPTPAAPARPPRAMPVPTAIAASRRSSGAPTCRRAAPARAPLRTTSSRPRRRRVPVRLDDALRECGLGAGSAGETGGTPILGLTADSRAVGPGFLFAALPGAPRRRPRLHRRGRGARRGGRAGARGDGVARRRAAAPAAVRRRSAPRPRADGRRLCRRAAGDGGRRHRHQRQDQHGGLPAPALDGERASARRRSARSAWSPRAWRPAPPSPRPTRWRCTPRSARWPAPACGGRRSRPRRTASSSGGWTGCGSPPRASPT